MSFSSYPIEEGKFSVITFMDVLRPVIRVNQAFGVCPLEISGHNIKLRFKSFKFIHSVATLIILICYFLYSLYQFVCSFGRGRSVPEIVAIATWVAGAPIPIAMLILTVLKRRQFRHFFEKSNEFRVPLGGMIRCSQTLNYSRKLFIAYLLVTIGSCVFVALDVLRKPNSDIFLLAYVKDPSAALIVLSGAFQCYLVILKSCGCAFIEVLCCCIGASFQNTINSIIEELHDAVGVNQSTASTPSLPPRIHKSFDDTEKENVLSRGRKQSRHFSVLNFRQQILSDYLNNAKNSTLSTSSENILLSIPTHPKLYFASGLRCNSMDDVSSNPFPPSQLDVHFPSCSSDSTRNEPQESNRKTQLDESVGPVINAIKKFNCVASMQNLLNSIFGPILALDIGQLVLVCCLFLYLKINYLGSGSVDYLDGFMFVGNCILCFVRLVVVFITLGNVHEMSINFNDSITTALLQVRKPTPIKINLVLAHLMSQYTKPSSFSAAGFFIFSRGSLLAVLSAIMTYVVFLLQARM